MTWTGQTFTVGQILTAAQMNSLQADISAAFNKDSGAPVLANSYIVEAMMGSASVNRASVKTATVTSLAGTLTNGGGVVDIALSPYCFFPMVHIQEFGASHSYITGHSTDGTSPDLPRFGLTNKDTTDSSTYDVEYRYIDA